MAIGLARVLGFRLMENFQRPYLATSLSEFWRRWHISLSTWFRDYVYISLGGNRKGFARQASNLLMVFGLSGLWHGANWTFVLWGIYHGVIVVFETFLQSRKLAFLPRNHFGYLAKLSYVFAISFIGWILFRVTHIGDFAYSLLHIFDFSRGTAGLTEPFSAGLLPQRIEFVLSFILIAGLFMVDWADERSSIMSRLARFSLLRRWAVYYFLIFGIYLSSFYHTTTQEFIYFQF